MQDQDEGSSRIDVCYASFVISFDCEAEGVDDTVIVPKGTKSFSINPLNWKTDQTPASKEENLGACFTDYSGEIRTETKGLCGAYIDEERGTIKITDVETADYPPVLSILPEGSYHIYDYEFFFRNLEKNVADRLAKYMTENMPPAEEEYLSEGVDTKCVIIGYSDITVYHSAWTTQKLPSIHACMSGTFTDTYEDWQKAELQMMTGNIPSYRC